MANSVQKLVTKLLTLVAQGKAKKIIKDIDDEELRALIQQADDSAAAVANYLRMKNQRLGNPDA